MVFNFEIIKKTFQYFHIRCVETVMVAYSVRKWRTCYKQKIV